MPENQTITALIILVSLVAYVALDASAQGGITLRNRLYVPLGEQPAINGDLHRKLPACYLLTCVCAAGAAYQWQWLAIGLLLRLALFDVILNHTKGDPLFTLGTSALTDRLLRRVGGSLASAVLRVGALAAAAFLVFR